MPIRLRSRHAAALCVATTMLGAGTLRARAVQSPEGSPPRGGAHDWRADWEVEDGLSLRIDSEGFEMPTAIAVVPNPGSGPKDPLYFVAELRGRIRVVTNDRSVHTFAEGFVGFRPEKELPEMEGESGLGAICLDPARGYVFATFVYQDSSGVMRNDIARFETTPGIFAIEPRARTTFTRLFAPWRSTISHQIGSCRVSGEHLFVSVADGRQTRLSQDTTALLGKVLRLTLDGRPAPGNPFRAAAAGTADSANGSAAVWAYGFRNPFGMTVVDGVPYVADNGSRLDRFVRVRPGQNYLWDGGDPSIALRADVVISPSVGPAHVEYVPASSTVLPASLRETFYIALSAPRRAGILGLRFDVREGHALAPPFNLVRWRGGGTQILSAISLGADGLYFAGILPDASGRTAVYRLAFDPEHAHPHVLLENKDPRAILEGKSCLGCHQIGGEGGTVGPTLDRDSLVARLTARLMSPEYAQRVAEIDRMPGEPFASYRAARAEVLRARGHDRLLVWTRHKIQEPRFDNPSSNMPDMEVGDADARALARHLLGAADASAAAPAGFRGRVIGVAKRFLPERPRARHLAMFGGLGFVAGAGLVALLGKWTRRGTGGR